MRTQIFFLTGLLSLHGCHLYQNYPEPSLDFTYHIPPHIEEEKVFQDNSIFSSSFAMNLYGNARDYKVGDVVMIRVNESAVMDNKASNLVKRSFKSKLAPPDILGFLPPSIDVGDHKRLKLQADVSSENDLDGEFGHKHSQKIQLMISGSVVSLLPGGKLLIQGEKEFYANNTAEIIQIRGIARQEDIMADNSIPAERLADLKFQFAHKGRLSEGASQGWFAEFWSRLWPF